MHSLSSFFSKELSEAGKCVFAARYCMTLLLSCCCLAHHSILILFSPISKIKPQTSLSKDVFDGDTICWIA